MFSIIFGLYQRFNSIDFFGFVFLKVILVDSEVVSLGNRLEKLGFGSIYLDIGQERPAINKFSFSGTSSTSTRSAVLRSVVSSG